MSKYFVQPMRLTRVLIWYSLHSGGTVTPKAYWLLWLRAASHTATLGFLPPHGVCAHLKTVVFVVEPDYVGYSWSFEICSWTKTHEILRVEWKRIAASRKLI